MSLPRLHLCAALLVVIPACSRQPDAASMRVADGRSADPAPRFEERACWRAVPTGITARCGFVVVPEQRASEPHGSIRLAVMVLGAREASRAGPQAPTLLLGGGPGGATIAMLVELLTLHNSLRTEGLPPEKYAGQAIEMHGLLDAMLVFVEDLDQRAFIALDQRGTGFSEPVLSCGRESWRDCRARLTAAGVDVAAYNTVENAADVHDVVRALGYQRVNLIGGSYGTRLALEVMRRHPESVRAAVLDGVAPPDVHWGVEAVRNTGDSFDVLFDHCAADASCNGAFPHLRDTFHAAVRRLDRQPAAVRVGEHVASVSGAAFVQFVWRALYDAPAIRYLPKLIADVGRGDTGLLGQMMALAAEGGDGIAWGMHYSVECSERWVTQRPRDLARAALALDPAIREGVVASMSEAFDICSQWRVPPAPALVHQPVASDIPTLLLSGEFDPGTPPAFAVLAARTLRRHHAFVLPYRGHCDGFTSGCQWRIMSAFLADPEHVPDAKCIETMDHADFVVR